MELLKCEEEEKNKKIIFLKNRYQEDVKKLPKTKIDELRSKYLETASKMHESGKKNNKTPLDFDLYLEWYCMRKMFGKD